LRSIGGRLKNDYRYSIGVVYNTFPWPNITDKAKDILTKTGQAILDARAAWPDASLADLYDPDTMPPNLRKAHIANDKAVDKLYLADKKGSKKFDSERERVEHLFALYETLTAPMLAAATPKKRRGRTRKVKL
ncbi:MAG: SAM-dependent methyltransferase, partial [Robiginitomaculum sp.]